jgi:3-oxoadipate enol-lactonase
MKYPLDNGFLAYEVIGNGIPLLFIHGFPLSRRIWKPQLEGLSDIASIISVDLRGHGESYPFDGPYSMDLLADDCNQLLKDLNIKLPILICGLSMGGYVAFALFRKYPQLFKGMILSSTRSGPDSLEGKVNRDTMIKNVYKNGVAFIAEGMLPKLVSPITMTTKPTLVNNIRNIMLETSVIGVVGALQGMRDRPDSTPILSEIKCPTLIIHGADDQLIPHREAELMNQRITNSNLVVLPESGHLLNMEQSEKYNLVIRDFIRSLSQD